MTDLTPRAEEGAKEMDLDLLEVAEKYGSLTLDQLIRRLQAAEARAATAEAEVARLTALVADYEEVLADKRRLAREIDVAMHGEEGAARQPSLCDLVGPASSLRDRVAVLEEALKDILPSKFCGESWGEPDEGRVAISTSFGAIRAARTALQGASDVKP